MVNTLTFGDPHIEDRALEELDLIFTEICSYDAGRLIMLGDYFHKSKYTHTELLFGLKWAIKFRDKYKDVVFLTGNGAHERIKGNNVVEIFQHVGIKVVNDFIDENNNYYGHFMVDHSKLAFGHYSKTTVEMRKYNWVFLGHEHIYEHFDNIIQLGSVRFVSYQETFIPVKYISILTDKEFMSIPLRTTVPMVDVYSVSDLPNYDKNTKIRIIYNNFAKFKSELSEFNEQKSNFKELVYKCDFKNNRPEVKQNKNLDLKPRLIEWTKKEVKDEEVKELVLSKIEKV